MDNPEIAIAVPDMLLYLSSSMTRLTSLLLLGSTTLAGCSRSSSGSGDSAVSGTAALNVASTSAAVSASDSAPKPAGCPRTGLWAPCSVEQRLMQSGFVVRRVDGEALRRPGFSVRPTVYTLGRTRLEVFIYPNESALSADVAKIDTAFAAPRGTKNTWGLVPTFARSGNLAAVFLTDNPTQAERFTLAITAGAPQP
jgi:hypothetical protein